MVETGPGNRASGAAREGDEAGLQALEARLAECQREVERLRRVEAEHGRLLREQRHTEHLEEVSLLAIGVAHRLNNLLHPILTFTNAAKERVADDTLHDHLDLVLKATRRARDLVRELQDFARQRDSEFEMLESGTAVREVVEQLIRTVPDRVRLTFQGTASGAIQVDRSGFIELLKGLLGNAVEAIEDHGEIGVTVRDRRLDQPDGTPPDLEPGNYLELEIQDSGIGIAKADLERIFEPFFTTKDENQHSGLGLALAWNLVRSWNGTIRAASTLGVGSTFSVLIPKAEQVIYGGSLDGFSGSV